jgi:chromosome segregation ATPase
MAEGVDGLPERLTSVETKLDSLAAAMERRFDEVAEALVEQRRYTDFAYERLDDKISRLDDRVSRLDDRMGTLETEMHSGFARMDRKLDQLIDRA